VRVRALGRFDGILCRLRSLPRGAVDREHHGRGLLERLDRLRLVASAVVPEGSGKRASLMNEVRRRDGEQLLDIARDVSHGHPLADHPHTTHRPDTPTALAGSGEGRRRARQTVD